jgi:predicted nuclease of predicted toxin-antitoxin system
MPRFLTDENFDGPIYRGLLAREPTPHLVRVQDVGLMQTPDPDILEWAARAGRVLLTHDFQTIPGFALERVRNGLPMPGILLVQRDTPVAQAIDEILVCAGAGTDADFVDQVRYIPM